MELRNQESISLAFIRSTVAKPSLCEALRTNSPDLPLGGADDVDERFRRERAVHRFDGGEGGLAPLARAVENAAARVDVEHGSLEVVGVEAEAVLREFHRIELVADIETSSCGDSRPRRLFTRARTAAAASGNGRRASKTMDGEGCGIGLIGRWFRRFRVPLWTHFGLGTRRVCMSGRYT